MIARRDPGGMITCRPALRRGPGSESGEPSFDRLVIGVVQSFEDRQGLLPALAGGGTVAAGQLRVPETGQDGGHVHVADLPADNKRPKVAGDGLVVVAEAEVGVWPWMSRVSAAGSAPPKACSYSAQLPEPHSVIALGLNSGASPPICVDAG